MEVMTHLIEDLPGVLKTLAMPTLAREFGPFLELYKELRPVAVAVESCREHKRKKTRGIKERQKRASEAMSQILPNGLTGPGGEVWTDPERERLD